MSIAPVPDAETPELEVLCDLDAIVAEADAKPPFPFRFDGEVYFLSSDPDIRASAAFGAGKVYEGFALLLGDDQWTRLQASSKTFADSHFARLVADYQAYVGTDLGE